MEDNFLSSTSKTPLYNGIFKEWWKMDENSYIYCQFEQLGLRCLFHRAGGNLVAVLVEGVVLVHHAAIVARTLLLLRDRPYFIRLDDTDVVEQPVVLVVVGNDDAAFLFLRQHELYIILNVASVLDEGSVDVAVGEVDDGEAVLQVAHDANYLVIFLLFLEHGDELRHAERRYVELLARQRIKIVQTGLVFLVSGIAAVPANEDVGVHEDVVGTEWTFLTCHRSEYQVWKLFLFLLSKRVRPAGGPEVHEVIYELTACQSVLLQEQFDHALALLLDLLVSFTHNYVV